MKMPVFKILTVFFSFLFFIACRKDDFQKGSDISYTNAPKTSSINTELAVYVYNNDQSTKPIELYSNTTNGRFHLDYKNSMNGFFSPSVLALPQYFASFVYKTPWSIYDPGILRQKSITLSSAKRNYIGVNYKDFTGIGEIRNIGEPTTLELPGGGALRFPDTVFDSHGIDMRYYFLSSYFEPSIKDYSINMPASPYADDKDRRWFLDSYGVYEIRRRLSYCDCNILGDALFFQKDVTLRMPINPARLGAVPDSIESWFINDNYQWEKDGFAYKKNGFFEKNTKRISVAWNFAKPVEGVYITLKLRTTNGIGITNTRYLIKSGQDEISDGRTDAEGNAFVFVPINKPLTFSILKDHFFNYDNIQSPDQVLGQFSTVKDITVVLPDRLDIGTLEGTVYKCGGTSFGNGTVMIAQNDARDNYVVPINNGEFKVASWLNANSPAMLSFFDSTGKEIFENYTQLGGIYARHNKRLKENFYACADASQLYCNYKIDGIEYSINGSMESNSTELLIQREYGSANVIIQDGVKGISFATWVEGGTLSTLKINNVSYEQDQDGVSEILTYRYDVKENGIFEGWFVADYLDVNRKSHTISGNFRLKVRM